MGLIERWITCPDCEGDRHDHGVQDPERSMNPCPECGGRGEVEYVRPDQLAGAVEANVGLREAVIALRSAIACGEPLTPVLQDLVNRALSHPGGQ
jgi:hypothetical protein